MSQLTGKILKRLLRISDDYCFALNGKFVACVIVVKEFSGVFNIGL